jgi:hypothetical protein
MEFGSAPNRRRAQGGVTCHLLVLTAFVAGCDHGSDLQEQGAIVKGYNEERRIDAATNTADSGPMQVVGSREEMISRYGDIFSELNPKTPWAEDTGERIKTEIGEFSQKYKGIPRVVFLECRGDVLCRIELDYERAQTVKTIGFNQIIGRKIFAWDGLIVSSALSSTRQLMFAVKKGYRFDGWNLVKRTKVKTTSRGSTAESTAMTSDPRTHHG